MFSSSMFMEDNDKDNSVDNDFFAKLVDDLFLDNEYFTFPTNSTLADASSSSNSSSLSSDSIDNGANLILSPASSSNSSADSANDGSCLSPFSQSDDVISTPIAYPAPAPLAIVSSIPSFGISNKRSRDFASYGPVYTFDQIASKVSAVSENPAKKRKEKEAKPERVEINLPKKNFIGVTYHTPSNRYRARIKIDNKTTHLGYFATEYEAAVAYDRAAFELRGLKAHLNFDTSVIDSSLIPNSAVSTRERCVAAAKSATGLVQPVA